MCGLLAAVSLTVVTAGESLSPRGAFIVEACATLFFVCGSCELVRVRHNNNAARAVG